MSYKNVCVTLGVPPLEAVLRTARLKFLQSMTRKPQEHQQFWSCVVGKYEFEEVPQTNPWAEQYCNDIEHLKPFDWVDSLVQRFSEQRETSQGQALRLLLHDKECRSEFLKFDVRQYKVYSVSHEKNNAFRYDYESPEAENCENSNKDPNHDDDAEVCDDDSDDENPFSVWSPHHLWRNLWPKNSNSAVPAIAPKTVQKTWPTLGWTSLSVDKSVPQLWNSPVLVWRGPPTYSAICKKRLLY